MYSSEIGPRAFIFYSYSNFFSSHSFIFRIVGSDLTLVFSGSLDLIVFSGLVKPNQILVYSLCRGEYFGIGRGGEGSF